MIRVAVFVIFVMKSFGIRMDACVLDLLFILLQKLFRFLRKGGFFLVLFLKNLLLQNMMIMSKNFILTLAPTLSSMPIIFLMIIGIMMIDFQQKLKILGSP